MKLLKIKKITGKIVVETGLHIGAGNETIEIGGMDNPVTKNPVTGQPYIPGSSLKGKIRSLLEWKYSKFANKDGKITGDPCNCGEIDCFICRIFGCADIKKRNPKLGPTRVVFRDCFLNEDYFKSIEKQIDTLIEEKHENSINRINSSAVPRNLERVVPGAKFDFEIIYKIYDMDDGGKSDEDNFKYIKEGIELIQDDYLGGGGSRGNGKISIEEYKEEDL